MGGFFRKGGSQRYPRRHRGTAQTPVRNRPVQQYRRQGHPCDFRPFGGALPGQLRPLERRLAQGTLHFPGFRHQGRPRRFHQVHLPRWHRADQEFPHRHDLRRQHRQQPHLRRDPLHGLSVQRGREGMVRNQLPVAAQPDRRRTRGSRYGPWIIPTTCVSMDSG